MPIMKREPKNQRLTPSASASKRSRRPTTESQRKLGKLRKELDQFAISMPPLDGSTPLIRRPRAATKPTQPREWLCGPA